MKILRILKFLLCGMPLAGKTLYDPRVNKFVHVKAIFLTGAECGDSCVFYNDAHTNIQRQMLSYDILSGYIVVGNIDKFKYAELHDLGYGDKAYIAKYWARQRK